MPSVVEHSRSLWDWVRSGATHLPTRVAVPPDHIVDTAGNIEVVRPLVSGDCYFQVRVNEMYLAASRKWFVEYDPMVVFASEFVYDKRVEAVPVVVGPAMLEKYAQQVPSGTILADTRVAGLHPYRGGRLILSVMLFRVRAVDHARQLLGVVEKVSGLGFATGLGTYLKVADLALDGVEALFGLQALQPLTGFRKELDPDAGDDMRPGYSVLIDSKEEVDAGRLWVRNGRLFYGVTQEESRPFRDADYVLYSVVADAERSDERTLPFYALWERVAEEAIGATKEEDDPAWMNAKAYMSTLYRTLMSSPDLTPAHADALAERYMAQMVALRDRARRIALMSGEERSPDAVSLDDVRARAASILEL